MQKILPGILRPLIVALLYGYWFLTTITASQAQSPTVDNVIIYYTQATPGEAGKVTVSAYVSVLDAEGQPVSDLAKNNFIVTEDKTMIRPELVSVSAATEPITVILVIDTSKGMALPGVDRVLAIDAVKKAAGNFISTALTEGSKVAIYKFDDNVSQGWDLTFDHNLAINKGIDLLDYDEATQACLYDALMTAIEKLVAVPAGRRAIIVITNASEFTMTTPCQGHTHNEVIRAALEARIETPIFSIGLSEANQIELANLAAGTNGQHFTADSVEQLQAQLQKIAYLFQTQYLLSYPTEAPTGLHTLTVMVEAKGEQAKYEKTMFVPVQSPPTPVAPSFAMNVASANNKLEIKLDLSKAKDVVLVELFVDNALEQRIRNAPFDTLTPIDITEFGPGEHLIRVEVTNAQKAIATLDRKFLIKATPTPLPTSTPLPATPTPAAPMSALIKWEGGQIGLMDLLLIIGPLLIGAGVLYYIITSRKEPRSKLFSYDEALQNTMLEVDYKLKDKDDKRTIPLNWNDTISESGITQDVPLSIRLTVMEGLNDVNQEIYEFDSSHNIFIGRDHANIENHIAIKDSNVSRRHAQIRHNGYTFLIKDLNSRHGTRVDGKPLEPDKEQAIPSGTKIRVGMVEFRLEATTRTVAEHPLDSITQDGPISPQSDPDLPSDK